MTKLTANAKTEKTAKIESSAKTKVKKVKKAPPAYMVFLGDLIKEGKYNQKELKAKGWEAFPEVAKSTIETVLVDSKNPRYNRFSELVVKGEEGILTFAK